MSEHAVVLDIRNLKTHFHTKRGVLKATDGVDLEIYRNRLLGIVGESGCGKSVLSLSILKLLPPTARISGSVVFRPDDGEGGEAVDLVQLDPRSSRMRSIRGGEIAMIFQEPMTALNPLYTIGNQIVESVTLHQNVTAAEARSRAIEMLALVGMPIPEKRIDQYAHELSGGLRQRAMIAMALSCRPKLLIADEPTTALDVTIQAQILDLIRRLQAEVDTSVVLITHDLGVIAGMADHVAVMYLGVIVEYGTAAQVFRGRGHPYTQGLFESIPRWQLGDESELRSIEGVVPDPMDLPPGCRFCNRCPSVMEICEREEPPAIETEPGHTVRCWLYRE